MKLSEKQLQCLEYVARGRLSLTFRDRARFKATTMEALARKGLVEHTSLGWRLTPEGHAELAARSKGSRSR